MKLINPDFNIKKAHELLQTCSKKDRLKKSFIQDLINYQEHWFSGSILYQELLIEKRYPRHLVSSTLKELGYELLIFKRNSTFKREGDRKEPEFHLIIFGPNEEIVFGPDEG